MRILLTRPEAAALSLQEKLTAIGHEVALAPVLTIEPVAFSLDALGLGSIGGLGGILLTSASAAPALSKMALAGLSKDMTVYTIGGTSADAARRAGFGNIISADGDREEFTALITARHNPASGPLLHLSGRHRAGDITAELQARGLKTERLQVYEAVAATRLPAHISNQIIARKIHMVLFFSPRSAGIFVSLAEDSGLGAALSGMTALCLSDAVKAAARPGGWKKTPVAAALNEAAMIDAIEDVEDIEDSAAHGAASRK